MTLYFVEAYPNSVPIYASSPEDALEQYRRNHPSDTREYVYTGAYRRWVITKTK